MWKESLWEIAKFFFYNKSKKPWFPSQEKARGFAIAHAQGSQVVTCNLRVAPFVHYNLGQQLAV